MARRRRHPVFLATLAVVAAVLAAGAVPLPAAPRRAWPRPVRVYNPTGWQRSVTAGIGAWNRTGAHVRLLLVRRAADADVIVVASDRALARACGGRRGCIAYSSRIGYRRGARRPARIYLPDAPERELNDDARAAVTAAHELGHILGLPHRGGCSIMAAAPLERVCQAMDLYPSSETYLCGPLPADVDDAVALYGGGRDPAYRPVCASSSA